MLIVHIENNLLFKFAQPNTYDINHKNTFVRSNLINVKLKYKLIYCENEPKRNCVFNITYVIFKRVI